MVDDAIVQPGHDDGLHNELNALGESNFLKDINSFDSLLIQLGNVWQDLSILGIARGDLSDKFALP
jgi:hypothetical protein